jgi:hypothetical protein
VSNVPAAIRAAIEPQVNLIPPEIAGRKAQGRRTGFIVLAFVALLGLIVAATYLAGTVRDSAQATLGKSLDEKARIETEIASYQYVIDMQAQLTNATSARLYAGAADLQWEPLLVDITNALPTGTKIITLGWAPTTIDSVTAVPDSAAFTVPDVGSIAISGQSEHAVDIPAMQDALDQVPGLARARVLTVVPVQPSTGGLIWTFTAEVRITYSALSGHFTDDWLASRGLQRSSSFFAKEVADANADLVVARADAAAGLPGAASRVGDALQRVGKNQGWADQAKALGVLYLADLDKVSKAQADVSATQGGTSEEVKAAQDALVAAQTSLATHRDALNAFTKVALKYADEVRAVNDEQARIAAAAARVAASEAGIVSAQAAVVAKTDGAAAALTAAQADKDAADAALLAERALLPDLEAAVTTTETDLVAAAVEAAKVAPVSTQGSGS